MRREKDSSPSFNSSYHVEGTDDFAAFELSERICSVVRGLRGDHFRGMELIMTHTDHNHEELLENIDEYRFLGQLQGKKAVAPQITWWFAEFSLFSRY